MSDRQAPPNLLSHPDREAAAALPALEDLFRSVARRVRTRLVNRAGSDVPVRLGVAQVTTVGHILDDSETRAGGIFAVFRFEPLGLPGLVVVQGRLLSRIVGVMLGENIDDEPPPYRSRQVTEVELRIAKRACEDVMNGLMESWPSQKPIRIAVDSIGTNPRAASGLAQTTPVVAASLDFGRPDDPFGLMIVAIPAQTTRDLRVPKVKALSRSSRSGSLDLERVRPVSLELVAELAQVQVPISTLDNLEIGSMIDLGPARYVDVKVNGHTTIVGEPGESRGCHSFRVLRKVESSIPNLKLVEPAVAEPSSEDEPAAS
ncbi:MAG: FliM/FliN family flagellar motor switch protein [Myxococcota bacterium]|nr:FliM/FliN family flagellar motor switch protein [Myxococcota bacterium]